MTRITYYHVLGVSSDATDDELAAAFRRKVKEWHPDISSHPDAEERMREINKAAEVLCNPERRIRYDRALAGKAPFESATAPKQRADSGIGWYVDLFFGRKAASSASPPAWYSRETIHFLVTGAAALFIFGLLILGVIVVVPLVAESRGGPATDSSGTVVMPLVPNGDPWQAQQEGDSRIAAGDFEGALRAYNTVIAQNPGISERDLWYNRGIALNALGLYPEASQSFDRALEIAPEDSFALAQKGAALIGLGRYQESLEYTNQALVMRSDVSWIWNNRGIALLNLGQQKEARVAFENANVFQTGTDSGDLYRSVVVRFNKPAVF